MNPAWYLVRLGPLRFEALADYQTATMAGRVEAVGSVLVPAESSPTPHDLSLPVRGSYQETNAREAGIRLRRQVRALLENDMWLRGGLFYEAGWDPESRAWLRVAGGELVDEGQGYALGEWRLNLSGAYVAGRPSSARRGRNVVIADRGVAGIASDTRRMLYTTDLSTVGTSDPMVCLPGDIVNPIGDAGRAWPSTAGISVDGRLLWRIGTASDGETISWTPDTAVLPDPGERDARVEEPGQVRLWALPGSYPASTTSAGDRDPTAYGWERVFGGLHDPSVPLAIDNGVCRVVWRGASTSGGLQVERWDASGGGRYVPVLRLLHRAGVSEARVIEVTPERAVVSWLVGDAELRAIMQRGWPGPRIESYGSSSSTTARLAVTGPSGGAVTRTAPEPWISQVTTSAGASLFAASHMAVAWSSSTSVVSGWGGEWSATRVLVQQLDVRATPTLAVVGRLARWDVQVQPTLVAR